jgi:hypothetical protein
MARPELARDAGGGAGHCWALQLMLVMIMLLILVCFCCDLCLCAGWRNLKAAARHTQQYTTQLMRCAVCCVCS